MAEKNVSESEWEMKREINRDEGWKGGNLSSIWTAEMGKK